MTKRGQRIAHEMPEELSADVARELLKHLVVASGKQLEVLAVVRALKACRAVNRTFRDEFEENKFGCRILTCYAVLICKELRSRIRGINAFLRMARETEGAYDDHCDKIEWIVSLRESLSVDAQNLKKFIDTLKYVRDGNVFRNLEVHHRANLPPHHFEHFSRTHGGLPKGIWKLSPSLERVAAPYRTTGWAVATVYAHDLGVPGRMEYATKLVRALFRITKEADNPMQRQVDEMRELLENFDFSDLSGVFPEPNASH